LDTKLVKWAEGQEKSMGDRGFELLPEGFYMARIDASESKIRSTKRGEPVLAPTMVVTDGPAAGKKCWGSWFWYSDEAKNPSTYLERQAGLRNMTRRDLMGFFYQAVGQDAEDVAESVKESLEGFTSEDEEAVREAMDTFLNVVDGLPFIAQVYHDSWQDEVRAKFRPYTYHRGQKTTSDDLFESWNQGLGKLPADLTGDPDAI
jgi:hypothetical protein